MKLIHGVSGSIQIILYTSVHSAMFVTVGHLTENQVSNLCRDVSQSTVRDTTVNTHFQICNKTRR